MKRIIATVALVAAVAAPTVAYAAHPAGGQYVVRIDGTQQGGFLKTFNTGETVSYKPLGQAQKDCWDLGGGSNTEYCLGYLDGTYPLLAEFKRALEKAHQ